MSKYDDRISLVVGDITKLKVGAVVNAANESLIAGAGLDAVIHRVAGPGLFEECRSIGLCPEGEARITKGYLLPARFIIHTVGPVFDGGGFGEADTLASCYRESLRLAEGRGIETIAFPCIATGVYGYPKDEACRIAVDTVADWMSGHELPRHVTFCCFGQDDADLYRERLGEIGVPA